MTSLAELRLKREALCNKDKVILSNMDKIIQENYRVIDVAHNAEKILDDLDRQFEEQTKLNGVDITFLFFATALQVARQYLLSNTQGRFESDKDGSKYLKKAIPRQYHDILLGSVPYDALGSGLSGVNHRYLALGHDPLLGWIFGTLNILTDSVTKNNLTPHNFLESYYVIPPSTIAEPVNIGDLFQHASELTEFDYKLLIASVMKQAMHLGTDAFTKQGLPVPILNNISPDFSSKFRVDVYGVAKAASMSILINMIIAAIHGLFYDKEKYDNRDVYEVKTRKILSYSNLIASTSNIIYVAFSAYSGNVKALHQLDIGGMIVTIYRIINDYNFIRKIKEEFIFGGFNKLIQGQEYNFEDI